MIQLPGPIEAAEPLVIGIPVLLVLLGLLIGYGLAPLGKRAQQIETRQADALTPVSLRQLAGEAVDTLQPRIGARRLQVTVTCTPANGTAEVQGDRRKLASLVGNLLDNAARYAPEASAIDVVLREERGAVTLEVGDEGPGIPEELRARVFESYYRIPGAAGGGSGLGLAIVR